MRRTLSIAASLVVLPLLLAGCAVEPAPEGERSIAPTDRDEASLFAELEPAALVAIARRLEVAPEALAPLGKAAARYEMLGKTVYEIKVVNQLDGSVHGIALDERGEEQDPGKLRAEEEAAREAVFGRLDPRLVKHLADAGDDELVDVAIWLEEPSWDPPARPERGASQKEVDELLARVDAERSAFVARLTAPLARRLAERGFEAQADGIAPMIHAALTPAAIADLGAMDGIARVYLSAAAAPTLAIAGPTVGANAVHASGVTGSGVKVGEIEVGGQINTSNPYLSGVTQDTTHSCGSGHATAVAGILRSSHATQRGIAPGADLWVGGSCYGSDSQLTDRSTAAINWGAAALNLSFGAQMNGALTVYDRYYDGVVLNNWRTVVASAANDGNSAHVASPGTAYNILTAGASDDRDTVARGDDIMGWYSCGVDPTSAHGDREKPEVVAPGTYFDSTTHGSPWIGAVGWGTSYSAPVITAAAALMMQRDASLQSWPEVVKAIVMTTATQNIEGASRLSELDGAGSIRADQADDLTQGFYGSWAGFGYDCSAASPLDATTMQLTAGKKTRVVIVWDNDPNYASYDTQPSADLDLIVTDATGSVVSASASWDNTYEIVEFTPATTGTYTLRINKYRCDLSPRYMAYAYFLVP